MKKQLFYAAPFALSFTFAVAMETDKITHLPEQAAVIHTSLYGPLAQELTGKVKALENDNSDKPLSEKLACYNPTKPTKSGLKQNKEYFAKVTEAAAHERAEAKMRAAQERKQKELSEQKIETQEYLPKPTTLAPLPPVTIAQQRTLNSQELDKLMQELEAGDPSQRILRIIKELEDLTEQSSLSAESFNDGAQPETDKFLPLVKEMNKVADELYPLFSSCKECKANPGFKRLDLFVNSMQETNAALAKKNNKLNGMTSFKRYTGSIKILHDMIAEYKQS